MTAKVVHLDVERSLRAAERHRDTVPCGPPEAFVIARLSDDGEDRILLHLEGAGEHELTEGAALTLSLHLHELVRIRRAARGLST